MLSLGYEHKQKNSLFLSINQLKIDVNDKNGEWCNQHMSTIENHFQVE